MIVTNGMYATGITAAPFTQSLNRIVATNAITVLSVNGPRVTTLDGACEVRCAYLGNGTVLSGFTLTNGTASGSGYGGGVYAMGAVVSNCVVCNSYASSGGGGAYGGSFYNCQLIGNSAYYGGGLYRPGALTSCTIGNNYSSTYGGGSYNAGNFGDGTFDNCLFTGNSASNLAGACYGGTLRNCTVVGNTSQLTAGIYNCIAMNSIVYFNTALPWDDSPNSKNGTMVYSCTLPARAGIGNITNNPQFANYAAGDYHLGSNSPCINAGDNGRVSVNTDKDGNPRIQGSLLDMGMHETPYAVINSLPGFGRRIDPSGRVPVAVSNDQTFVVSSDPLLPSAPLSCLGMMPR